MQFAWILALVLALVAPTLATAAEPAWDDLPMQVVTVQLSDPTCAPHCPRWIAAQGRITAETPALFRDVLRQTRQSPLPILIESGGGLIDEALATGRMLRQAKAHVVVSATRFDGCAPGHDGLPPESLRLVRAANLVWRPLLIGLYLSDRRRRPPLHPPFSLIGVHQIKRIAKPGAPPLVLASAQKELLATAKIYDRVKAYLREAALPDTLVILSYTADHAHIHDLTPQELMKTVLATDDVSAEKLFGLPAFGFDEISVANTPAAAQRPPRVLRRAGGQQVERPARSVLQVRMGGNAHSPLMLVLIFTPSELPDEIAWRAQLYRRGTYSSPSHAALALTARDGPVIAPTLLQATIDPRTTNTGLISHAAFCQLESATAVKITLTLAALSLTPLPLQAERASLPWLDTRLFATCGDAARTPAPPARPPQHA